MSIIVILFSKRPTLYILLMSCCIIANTQHYFETYSLFHSQMFFGFNSFINQTVFNTKLKVNYPDLRDILVRVEAN